MRTLLAAVMFAAAMAAGCDGTGAADANARASCGKVQPCGGDVAGTWTVAANCGPAASFGGPLCTTVPQSNDVTMLGTAVFNADRTYRVSLSVSGSMTVGIDLTMCSTGSPRTCADIEREFQAGVGSQPEFDSIECEPGGIGCLCTAIVNGLAIEDAGMYGTGGTTLGLSGSSDVEYCVQENALHLITLDMAMGNMQVFSDVVLTK